MQKKRIARLIAGTLMMLVAGIIYSWSILKSPLASEFQWNDTAWAQFHSYNELYVYRRNCCRNAVKAHLCKSGSPFRSTTYFFWLSVYISK